VEVVVVATAAAVAAEVVRTAVVEAVALTAVVVAEAAVATQAVVDITKNLFGENLLARSPSKGAGLLIFSPSLDVHFTQSLRWFLQLFHSLCVTYTDVGISGPVLNPAEAVAEGSKHAWPGTMNLSRRDQKSSNRISASTLRKLLGEKRTP
jgi:hypothetical protein